MKRKEWFITGRQMARGNLDAWKERQGICGNRSQGWLPNGNMTERVRTTNDVEWDYYRTQHKDRAVFFRLGVRFYVHLMERRSDAIKGTVYLREVRYL